MEADGALIGCDTGGTFTDFVVWDPASGAGGLRTAKLPSTPDDPSRAILDGVRQMLGRRMAAQLCHATTVATNALLERRLARVGYLTTEGFADSLWLGRGERSNLTSLRPHRLEPPLRREDVREVRQRHGAHGETVRDLDPEEIARLAGWLEDRPELDPLAVCLLHATLQPDHERRLAQAFPGRRMVLSHRIDPGPGEYERGLTTLIAAALTPLVDNYLTHLQAALPSTRLWVVHSSGGLLTPEEARAFPHRLALSGPAAGLRGALSLAQSVGFSDILTLDMGGTSSDVALCFEGELPYVWETAVAGYPLRAPSLEIHTVGAGGGSLAFRDGGGLLRVGPRSAGAIPGPACYGRGGQQATVTDALCWAGYLPPDLGGFPLQPQASERALRQLAQQLELTCEQTALGILAITVEHLSLAVRRVSTARGHDPKGFTLVPFGGAGPMLACQVAEALEMERILVPASAGVLSAWGALTAPWEREWATPVSPADRRDPAAIDRQLEALGAKLPPAGPEDRREPLLARRYQGQGDTLIGAPQDDFHQLHHQRYGFHRPDAVVETVEVRWRSRGPQLSLGLHSETGSAWRAVGHQPWLQESGWTPIATYRGQLPAGQRQDGPFLLFAEGATVVVRPGWTAQGLPGGHLQLQRSPSPTADRP